MKNIKFIFLLLLFSCTSSKVMYDYDAKTDFTKYKTFGFFKNVGEGLNELDIKRLLSAINREMVLLGFSKVDEPDFFIDFKSKITENIENNTVGIGIGGGGRNGGFGISGGIPIGSKKLNEELILDFVDSKNEELFWQGISNTKIKEKRKPEEKELHYKEIIKRILNKYPPEKKK